MKKCKKAKSLKVWALAGSNGEREIITRFGTPFLMAEDKRYIERWLELGTFRIARVLIKEI